MVEGSSRLFSHKDLFFKRIEFPFRICRMNLRQQPGVRGLSCWPKAGVGTASNPGFPTGVYFGNASDFPRISRPSVRIQSPKWKFSFINFFRLTPWASSQKENSLPAEKAESKTSSSPKKWGHLRYRKRWWLYFEWTETPAGWPGYLCQRCRGLLKDRFEAKKTHFLKFRLNSPLGEYI